MKRRPPGSTRTATIFPYTTLFRSMTLYASVRGDWNDYDATPVRRDYDTLGGSLQWEWQPSPATVASAWYGYDRSDLDIANVNDVALTPDPTLGGTTYPIANRWWIDDRQRNHYAGANLTQRLGRVTRDAALAWTYPPEIGRASGRESVSQYE